MALSREVEIILKADGRAAKAAYDQIVEAATQAGDDATKAALSDYAQRMSNTAAQLVSATLASTNRRFAANLESTIENASQGISAGIRAAMAESDDIVAAEKLRQVKRQMEAFEKLAKDDVQSALSMGIKDAFKAENLRELGSSFSDGFTSALNGVDLNDLGGFVKTIGGAASKGLVAGAKAAKAGETAATASGDLAKADALATAASVMSAGAVAFTAVAAALALFVAYGKAADDYQSRLNKTLLEGASVADIMGVAYQEGARSSLELADTMQAARKASVDTAVQFRMSTEETARVLQDLNSAGITYKRIVDGAQTAAEAQYRFAEAINRTITYSSLLGVSVSELASYQNTLMKDVNMSLDRTFDVFAAINEASMASGMSTKTFFTAISQATSGMALYNVRIDQAIGLIKSFGEIVGETDAGKVLGDLTGKKGIDERLRIAAAAIETVGLEKVQDLFRRTTEAGAAEFQRSFSKDSDAILKVFRDFGQEALGRGLLSGDAAERAEATKALATLPDDIRERIKAGMGGVQGGAASRAFGAFALSAKGTVGGVDETAGVMNKLDMAGKILMMDYQARALEAQGQPLESATSKATLQQFLGALGLDEDQLEPILRYRQYADMVESIRGGKGTQTDKETLERLGFTVQDDKVMKGDDEIRDLADVVYGLGVATAESEESKQARADAVQRQRMQGTITEALNAWVQGSLFESALAPNGLLGEILKWISDGEKDPERMEEERRARIAAIESAQAGLDDVRARTEGDDSPTARSARADAEAMVAGAQFGARLTPGVGVSEKELDKAVGRSSDVGVLLAKELSAYQQAAVGAMTGRGDGFDDKAKADLESLASTVLGRPVEASFDVKGGVKITPTETPTPTPATDVQDVQDAFISKDGAMYRGPSADNILMFKDGGPLDPRTGGGGGNVVININGGDQAMVYRTVARAMRATQG